MHDFSSSLLVGLSIFCVVLILFLSARVLKYDTVELPKDINQFPTSITDQEARTIFVAGLWGEMTDAAREDMRKQGYTGEVSEDLQARADEDFKRFLEWYYGERSEILLAKQVTVACVLWLNMDRTGK